MEENIKKQDVIMKNRNYIELSGVNKIVSFDGNLFVLDSCMGIININGNALELVKLDTVDGIAKIKGNIDSLVYKNNIKKNKDSLWNNLFK